MAGSPENKLQERLSSLKGDLPALGSELLKILRGEDEESIDATTLLLAVIDVLTTDTASKQQIIEAQNRLDVFTKVDRYLDIVTPDSERNLLLPEIARLCNEINDHYFFRELIESKSLKSRAQQHTISKNLLYVLESAESASFNTLIAE